MRMVTHRIRVAEARRVKHPTFTGVEKHYFTVRAKDVPPDISTAPNAREPVGMNRQVYRDVRDSLLGKTTRPGSFDLMNKGITVLAEAVHRVEDDVYDIELADGQGIVDGGHTYQIILDNRGDPNLPPEQHVEILVRTGIDDDLITDIARGLNTSIQVQKHSLADLAGAFDWLKAEIGEKPWAKLIAWREGEDGEYDVRDLISVLEALNVMDFPNDQPLHPISAYEKWSVPLGKFAKDFEDNDRDPTRTRYYHLRGLLLGGLELYDIIRRDFRAVRNEAGGKGGKLNIVEGGPGRTLTFPFAGLPPAEYRLTKGALMPILAAFRNCVAIDPVTGDAQWIGGFETVRQLWKESRSELVYETVNATEFGNRPDQIGKNRQHWANLHKTVKLRVLERRLADR